MFMDNLCEKSLKTDGAITNILLKSICSLMIANECNGVSSLNSTAPKIMKLCVTSFRTREKVKF